MASQAPSVTVAKLRWRVQHFGLPRDKYAHEDLAHELASDEVVTAIVLMVGAPPSQPDSRVKDDSLEEFASYIHDLAVWTMEAKEALMQVWGITLDEYEQVATYHAAFDTCISKWYALRPKEVNND